MKKNYILWTIGGVACMFLFVFCSRQNKPWSETPEETAFVALRLPQGTPADPVRYNLYIFAKESGTGNYAFTDSISPLTNGSLLKFQLPDLQKNDYRFLFVAFPPVRPGISVQTVQRRPPAEGDAWDGIRIWMTALPATADCYCGVTEMTGEEILASGTVRGDLKRIAGQMIFDFFRTGEGGVGTPTDIVSEQVASVMDRVKSIDITYSGLTDRLVFDADNRPVAEPGGDLTLVQTIHPELDERFRVSFPQPNPSLEAGNAGRGSVRVKGPGLFPGGENVRVLMHFTYYDTTPACGNSHPGAHDETCFRERTLELNLPETGRTGGLPVVADHFTVNKAGLHCDRIIDVERSGGITADLNWKEEEI